MTLICSHTRPPEALGQTHVLIVAVGSYPHLSDGTDPTPGIGDMKQLDSPPLSGAKIADWFIEQFHNPQRPLGSIDLLLSNDADQRYLRPDTHEIIDVELAEIDRIIPAALAWKERGDQNPEDMLVFMFSGHGLASGTRQALLTRDYGRLAQRPLRGAISLFDMIEGMKSCKAGRQLFFIDACRTGSATLMRNATETGDVLIPASEPMNKNWLGCLYHASLGGMPAYGVPGEMSLFTKALLKSLRGPGSSDDNAPGTWWINTVKLSEALSHMASDLADPRNGPAQRPQAGYQTMFEFHLFADTPEVPIYIQPNWYQGDDPPHDTATLSISQPDALAEWTPPWQPPNRCSWAPDRFEYWVEPGYNYTVKIHPYEGEPVPELSRYVHPPYKLFPLDWPNA